MKLLEFAEKFFPIVVGLYAYFWGFNRLFFGPPERRNIRSLCCYYVDGIIFVSMIVAAIAGVLEHWSVACLSCVLAFIGLNIQRLLKKKWGLS